MRLDSGGWLRVRIAEATPRQVRVKKDDWGDMTADQVYYALPFPVPTDALRALSQ